MEKYYEDKQAGTVTVRKSTRARRISIRVNSRTGVSVTVPSFVPYKVGLAFYLSKRDWALKALERQRQKVDSGESLAPEQVEELRKKAKEVLPKRLAELAKEHSFSYNSVRIKHNLSNWGSCSSKGNINLNLNLVRLPDELRDYVLLHELCHTVHHDHSPRFHALLESVCPGHKARQKEIRQYTLL